MPQLFIFICTFCKVTHKTMFTRNASLFFFFFDESFAQVTHVQTRYTCITCHMNRTTTPEAPEKLAPEDRRYTRSHLIFWIALADYDLQRPTWVSDETVTKCYECTAEFTPIHRKVC